MGFDGAGIMPNKRAWACGFRTLDLFRSEAYICRLKPNSGDFAVPLFIGLSVVEFRNFKNSDPPKLVRLWHQCQFGRGAASGFTVDAFETLVFSQPYFRRDGLIFAVDGDTMIGFIHAGFGASDDESTLSLERGAICALGVRPDNRKEGVGRELVKRAEEFLQSQGATGITAGASPPHNPFYLGIYGGSQPSGFLETDMSVKPFFESLGYQDAEQHLVYQRNLESSDPMNMKLMQNRRKLKMAIRVPSQDSVTWWWTCRFGRLDSLMFQLSDKSSGEAVATVGVIGLDLYRAKWNRQAVGLTNLWVKESERGKGYGQTLLIEVCRRLRDERVTTAEIHAPADNEAMNGAAKAAGFRHVDTGHVFKK